MHSLALLCFDEIKSIDSKAAFKMKLTPAVNFINFIRARFSYERRTRNVHVTRKKAAETTFYEKFIRKMLMKLTPD